MRTQIRLFATLAPILAVSPAVAATAQSPSISGNVWVAIAIVGGLVAIIVLLAFGSFGLEKRDAKLGRRGDDDDGGAGLGMF